MSYLLQTAAWTWMPAMAAGAVISGLWQGAVLASVVWVLLRMVPGTSAAVRFVVWTVVFAAVSVLPFVDAYMRRGHSAIQGDGVVHVDARWSFAIAAVWALCSMARLIGLVAGAVRLRGIWRRAVPVDGCEALVAAAGGRGVQVCTSVDVDRPSVIGFFSPRVLIPAELVERLTASELEQIVLHEVSHLRRRDDWTNLLQKIGLVVLPLNPALLWVDRRMCFERELACDDRVLAWTRAPKAYARCLTTLAETRLGRRVAALSLGAWERQSELARRVHSILGGGWKMGRMQARAVMGVALAVVMGGAIELARCPEVISFSSAESAVAANQSVGAGYQPVMFDAGRRMGSAHATLLNASVPRGVVTGQLVGDGVVVPKRVKTIARAAAIRKAKRVEMTRAVVRMSQQVELPRAVMMTTSWEESTAAAPVRLVVAEDGQGTRRAYAAVATEGGWLVFQL